MRTICHVTYPQSGTVTVNSEEKKYLYHPQAVFTLHVIKRLQNETLKLKSHYQNVSKMSHESREKDCKLRFDVD